MLDTYYPLEQCKQSYIYNPNLNLRVKYYPLKQRGLLNYRYINNADREDDNNIIPDIFGTGFVIQNVGRQQDDGTYNGNLKRYVIYFSDRFPNLQRIIINNTLADKGIVPYIYEYGTVENENNENIYYWISDYFTPIKPLDVMCKQDIFSLPSVYEMFYNILSILHKENYVITEFKMSEIFLGKCDSYRDNIETIFCTCNYDKWFNHPPQIFNRNTREYEDQVPTHGDLTDFYDGWFPCGDFSAMKINRYSSISTSKGHIKPIDNWMSVMFILLDAMDMFIPACITSLKLKDETFKPECEEFLKVMYKKTFLDKHPELIDECVANQYLNLIREYQEIFMIYVNSIFASIVADYNLGNNIINIDYIEENIGTFVNKVSEKTGIECKFYCLFITCLAYISHVNHSPINYVNDDFMKRLIDIIKQHCIVYTCKLAYNNNNIEKFIDDLVNYNSKDKVDRLEDYMRQQTQNDNIDILDYVLTHDYMDFAECLYMCSMNIPKYKISLYSLNAYENYEDIITKYCTTYKLCVNTNDFDFVINYVNNIMQNIETIGGTLQINKQYLINNDYLLRMYKCANESENNLDLNIADYFFNTDINNINILPKKPYLDFVDDIRNIIDCSDDDNLITFGIPDGVEIENIPNNKYDNIEYDDIIIGIPDED